ncbi:MAG TPA: UDP-N-acetylmuramoyl-L-alanyl-D-glutamate--2,6-diaminopimelate ligase [Actinomycetota bacterium]|nr:UDP-N-acetylmuramoyl-L-alanyl-D-glutamate--2,6-diaminopimelate ligase [Actinomycetota bacterium]
MAPHTPEARPLSELLTSLAGPELRGDPTTTVTSLAYRSQEVEPGSLFFCIPGSRADGHDFAAEAVALGASALVVERGLDLSVPQVLVPSVRGAMGPISAAFFARPSDRLTMVGVTGTNGKTTTTYLLESVFRASGLVPGVVGTTGVRIDGEPVPFPRTTPEAPDLHRLLRRMVDRGVEAVAMEVSSHGLDQHRVDAVRYRCAVFTNLTQDHLDYHASLEDYFQAKARLFTPELSDRAVVNHDSPEGRRLLDGVLPTLSYGIEPGADVRATEVRATSEGIAFSVDGRSIRSSLRGRFNVENCLAALAASRSLGIDDAAAVIGIERVRGVPGRVETVEEGQGFLVMVDYAHTPDSVENVLRAARQLATGRLIVVFGCGGDRDRGKRPLMGKVATSLADLTVVTSDNPRSEEPAAILADIEPGARAGGGPYLVEADRRTAIRVAVERAQPGDVVVIAGKGHETYQELADRTIPFDDRLVVAEELRGRMGTR